MGARSAYRPYVIIYIFASPYLCDGDDEDLREVVEQQCTEQGFLPVEVFVDRGPPKSQLSQYPALGMLRYGGADLLVVVRSPMYRREAVADWLESHCPEGPFVCLPVTELRASGLLPPLIARRAKPAKPSHAAAPATKPRSSRTAAAVRARTPPRWKAAVQRAKELRAQGLDVRQIGLTLADEEYQPPQGELWTIASVARLLGLEVLDGGRQGMMAAESRPPWGR